MISKETLELLQKDIILETPPVDPREGLIVSSPWSPPEVLFEEEFPMNLFEEEPPERPLRSTFVEYSEEPTGKYLVIHIVDISEEVLRPPRRFHPWSLRRCASLGSLPEGPLMESPVEYSEEEPPVKPKVRYLAIHIVDISEEVLRPPRRFHPWSLRRCASLGSLSMSPTEESPVELPVELPVEYSEGSFVRSFVGFSEEYSEGWSSGDSA